MKESGINYFFSALGLDTGSFSVMYVYEGSAGLIVPSVSGAQSGYAGTLSSLSTFWAKPGSGFYSGTTLTVSGASGAYSDSWTEVFVYEQTQTGRLTLFNSLTGGSGYKITVNDANKVCFEAPGTEPIVAASLNNLSSKNAIALAYTTNYLTINYLNVNAQQVETEAFGYPFQVAQSDAWTLGGGAPYYADYFLHISAYQSPDVIGQLLSGLYARPTGYGYPVTITSVTGITGYQNVFVGETGITGYAITPGGDEGRDYYTGAFPTTHTTTYLTGYLSSGIYASGITGLVTTYQTGDYTALLEYLTGYASSFGMRKVQLFTPLISTDIVKAGYSYVPFSDLYNDPTQAQYSGYQMITEYPTGLLDVYLNGVAQAGSGWYVSGIYFFISGSAIGDQVWFDLKSGDKKSYPVAGGQTGFFFPYSGQEIYLNGINLVSGLDYIVTGNLVNLRGNNTGINGDIFEYPVVLTNVTGRFTVNMVAPFQRDTSAVYLNGVRQQEDSLYVEGGAFDLLSGQYFNYSGVTNLYNDNDLYWE